MMVQQADEERVRFCDHCNAVTSWWSVHCEECGQRLGHVEKEERGRKSDRLEGPLGDLFRAHMRLLHRARGQAKDLTRRMSRYESLLGRSLRRASRDEALSLSRQLIELEEDWEEIQETYNRQCEVLEEGQEEGLPELHEDLLPDLQTALETEFGGVSAELGTLAERLHRAGGEVDILLARVESRFLGIEWGQPRVRAAVTTTALLLAVAGPVGGALAGLPIDGPLALASVPGLAAVVLLLLARPR